MKKPDLKAIFRKKAKPQRDDTVKNYVESFFEPIRYSKESSDAKSAVVAALIPEYEKLKRDNGADAFRVFVAKYPDIETLLDAAGIDRANAAKWREQKANVSYEEFMSSFKKRRLWAWIITAIFVFVADSVTLIALYFSVYSIPMIVLNAALIALGVFFAVRFKRTAVRADGFSVDNFDSMAKHFDRYGKKSINWLMLLYIEFFIAVFDVVSLGVNSRSYEIAERLATNLRFIAFVALFFVKNLLIARWLIKNVDYEDQPKYKREFRGVLIFSSVYWAFALGLYFVFEYYLVKNISVAFFIVYILCILGYNVFRLKKFCYTKSKFAKPAAAVLLIAAMGLGGYTFMSKNLWMTQPYINSVANVAEEKNTISYDEATGIYTITKNAEAGKTVSSMAFFHIPLQQYRTAYELYEAGSDEVTYYFGSNDEKMIDKVCCSEYPSAFFDIAKELGSTTAMFCGHDHYNNISLEYQGIRLTYGMSIDYLVMPGIARETKQRGGTLITCHADSSYEIAQIPLTSIG